MELEMESVYQKAQDGKQNLALIMNKLPDGIVIVDKDLSLVKFVNKAFIALISNQLE